MGGLKRLREMNKQYPPRIDAATIFDFSPCHPYDGSNQVDANKEDCSGSTFPSCGGGLWAQGVIQCP